MANQTPDANNMFNVYRDGTTLLGVAQVDMPNLQAVTAEVKGAGIAGPIDKVMIGLFQSMTMTLNFRTVTADGDELQKPKQHHLECWAAVQTTDPGSGQFLVKQHKITVRGEAKNVTLGKLSVGETQDRSIELEIVYFKEEFDGVERLEIDKYNCVYRVGGEDMFADVRAAIGM